MPQTIRKKYQTDKGSVFYAVLDERPAVLTVAGEEPAGALTENMTLRVTANKNSFGIHPRYALFARQVGSQEPPTDDLSYSKSASAYKKIPLLTPAAGNDLDTAAFLTLEEERFNFVRIVNERVV